MKISYNWLKQFIQTSHTPKELSLILTDIGLEVESLHQVQSIPGGLEGLLIGQVKECIPHPNADRLKVTKVNVGEAEDLQIVCGATNVAVGQKVVIAPVNTIIHPTSGNPFKINKAKIRGEVSEGMICAEDEIGLGSSHEEILVLDPDTPIGTLAKSYFDIEDDYCFEIGLTPNRADAASHLGVARDLAAYLNIAITMPDIAAFTPDNDHLTIPVLVEDPQACRRYSSLTISQVTVKESPKWLQEKLNVIGIRSINNIVDATNYVLHELGQPLHAFDAEAIDGGKVLVKKCIEGTSFKTLDGVEHKLSAEDLMICNAEKAMCIAGVFGGIDSGVKTTTKNIFIESAWFDAVSTRKTAKRHSLKTDASFRFERGTDPEMTVFALKRVALLIKEIAGGQISSSISDFYPVPAPAFTITVRYARIDLLIGKMIARENIKSILMGLGIIIKAESEKELIVQIPTYKVDITREVDIIEEVLRIYGYNNIEISSQIKASLNHTSKPDKEIVQNQLADLLTANGFIEILSNSLTKLTYALNPDQAVKILNPLSSDQNILRQSMLFSGLEAVSYNQNRKNSNLKLYEFGKIYSTDGSDYKENQRLAIWITGSKEIENWNTQVQQIDFYTLKSVVDTLLQRLNIREFNLTRSEDIYLTSNLSYINPINGGLIVQLGSVQKSTLKLLDIANEVFYADFNWDMLLNMIQNNKIAYKEIPKFPSVRRDLSMLLKESVLFSQLKQIAQKTEKSLLKEVHVFDTYTGDKLPKGKKSYGLSFTLQNEEGTLTEKQIESIMQKLIHSFEKEVGAEIRGKF